MDTFKNKAQLFNTKGIECNSPLPVNKIIGKVCNSTLRQRSLSADFNKNIYTPQNARISEFNPNLNETTSSLGSDRLQTNNILLNNNNDMPINAIDVNSVNYQTVSDNLNFLDTLNFADPNLRILSLVKLVKSYCSEDLQFSIAVESFSSELKQVRESIKIINDNKAEMEAKLVLQLEEFISKATDKLNLLTQVKHQNQSLLVSIMENKYTMLSIATICYALVHLGTKYFNYKMSIGIDKTTSAPIKEIVRDVIKELPPVGYKILSDINFFQSLKDIRLSWISLEILSAFKEFYSKINS